MRIFHVHEAFTELPALPAQLPAGGFVWIASGRREFEVGTAEIQAALGAWGAGQLVDLHLSDLLNNQLPSQHDYTSWYDVLVFRRLAAAPGASELFVDDQHGTAQSARRALASIDTSPVGFALFDRVLLTVHPTECSVREFFISRLAQLATPGIGPDAAIAPAPGDAKPAGPRLPPNPADLMLRIVNHMVDGYLDLRRLLTRQLGYLQQELLGSRSGRFDNWQALLESRNALHALEDICEDQRSAIQEWIDALAEWPLPADKKEARERELLRVRSKDVLEHIERVLGHVRRLESSAESSVQMYFSAQSNRMNDIMRTLTVITAIFMPLNLITGIFGMNFDALPLIHSVSGTWLVLLSLAVVPALLIFWFRRKNYIDEQHR
ncbi:magnesium transporter CorA family protein [Rivibacter subsaxonicus]|uniref:Mg2+ and Co2+ transporter CorA n=1 Tax=Rivibacter subsaxonicus TaxID=457575 RepID=A0A4V2FU43_9BURK|nr:magnesium transporter CorA family protein [Rivibacter subsaxonicus]RZU00566.1 Mg2+ and Co2+ transporter CorA [Rivibacter subsaxonicus]